MKNNFENKFSLIFLLQLFSYILTKRCKLIQLLIPMEFARIQRTKKRPIKSKKIKLNFT